MNLDKFYDQAYTWILTVGPRILLGIIIVLVGLWLIRFLKKWLNNHLVSKRVDHSIRSFLINLAIIALQVLLVFSFMQVIGIQMTVFAALIGAFGVAAGLALSGTFQNFASGILIILLKPYRVGDTIIAQGLEGTVSVIQVFFTIMKTADNKTVFVPNSKLSNEVIINLSREGKRRMDVEIKFNFGIDFEEVKKVIEKSILSVEGLLKQPAYNIGVSTVEQDGYKILVSAWVPANQFYETKMLLQQKIVEDVKQSGVKLPGTV
ncbi:MAG: mechanosensitive ion channel family protein [Bacteroidota bacterium]